LKHELEVFKHVTKEKGIKGMYSGYSTNFVKQFSKSIYRYPLLSGLPRFYANLFGSNYENNKHKMKLMTSVSLAVIEATIITPFERLQVFVMTSNHTKKNYGEFFGMLKQSNLRTELFKGYTPYLTRQLVIWTSFLQADTFVKNQVRKYYNIPPEQMIRGAKLLFCSAFVATCTIVSAMPFDNIKTFLQKYNLESSQKGELVKKEANIPMAIKKIYQRSGPLGFFIGWRVKLCAYFVNASFTVTLLEWLDNISDGAFSSTKS
jgi:ribosomal protein S17E